MLVSLVKGRPITSRESFEHAIMDGNNENGYRQGSGIRHAMGGADYLDFLDL